MNAQHDHRGRWVASALITLSLLTSPARAQEVPTSSTAVATETSTLAADTSTETLALVSTTTTSTVVALSEEWNELVAPSDTSTTVTLSDQPIEPPPAESPTTAQLRLVFTGNNGGIGSGRYELDAIWSLQDILQSEGGRVEHIEPHHGALAQGLHVLVSGDRSVATSVAFLAQGGIRCGEPRQATSIRTARERLLFNGGTAPAWVERLPVTTTRAPFELRECTGSRGVNALLYSPKKEKFVPPRWSVERFEFRLSLHVQIEEKRRPRSFEIVGIPRNEASRRYRLLAALVSAKEGTLYTDGGSFVDGTSTVKNAAMSIHRPLTFEMLRSLSPAALAPGQTELLGGARRFIQEARALRLPYVAANWRARDESDALPPSIVRSVETPLGTIRVGFIGLIDPSLSARAPQLKQEGITLAPPEEALAEAVEALRTSSAPPDLTLVVSEASASVLRAIAQQVQGIDLIIGDASSASERLRRTEHMLSANVSPKRLAALVLPIDGITVASLELVRAGGKIALRSAKIEPHRMAERLPPDPAVLARISRTRAKVYPPLDRPLLAAPDGPLDAFDDTEWRTLVCEAVRSRSDADIVLLPELPRSALIPGRLTELLVSDRLGVLDRLEKHFIPGDRLGELLREAPRFIQTACGATIGKRSATVLGRGVEPDRLYRVVSTDRARVNGLDALLAAAYARRFFDRDEPEPVMEGGDQLTLRRAVLTHLRELRDETVGETAPVETLLADSSSIRLPIALLRVSRLSARVERFQGAEDPAFASVPETRATSPSSLTVGVDTDAALILDASSITSDLRLRATYNLLSVGEEDPQETADDLRLSTSTALPLLAVPVGPLSVMPYAELLFDSEFTPVEAPPENVEDELPRQADLFLTVGLSASGGKLTRLRAGPFVSRRLAEPDKPTELGARTEAEAQFPFGPDLRFITTFDGTYFASTGEDTERDLQFRALLEGRIALPLSRAFDLSMFAQVFGFQGRVPETSEVRASYTFGFSFDLRGAFAL